jgi:UDP-arabinose 4-epimerase
VGESVTAPAKYYDNNIGGTANLIAACAAHGCRNIVFSSTCATYGVPERLPLNEDSPQRPVNPYGYTKLAVEWLRKDAETAHGLRHVALRYFNAAGADPTARSAKYMTQRPISFRWCCSPRWGVGPM